MNITLTLDAAQVGYLREILGVEAARAEDFEAKVMADGRGVWDEWPEDLIDAERRRSAMARGILSRLV